MRFGPIQIIRILLIAIIVMIGLLFARYIYLPKRQILAEIQKNIEKAEDSKILISRQVVEARSKIETARTKKEVRVEKEGVIEEVRVESKTEMDKLLADLFTIGDVEQVSLLYIKSGKKETTYTPVEFSVKGGFFNTLHFLEQAAALNGVGGISSIIIENANKELGSYVVTTTFSMPTWID